MTLLLALTAALSACGGNGTSAFAGGSSSSSSGGGSSSQVASITLISSTPQIPSDGSTPATITAIVKNTANSVVPGAGVVFSTSSGVIAPTQTNSAVTAGTTDSNGEAAASLSTPGDPTNRTITVTVTVGAVSQTLNVDVVGTKLTLSGPTTLIQGANGTFSAALTDSGGNGIANTAVAVSSANGNTLSASNLTTDNTGHVTFTLTASNAGADTVSATALGLTATAPLSVSSQSFTVTTPVSGVQVPLNTAQTITVVWKNSGAAVTGQPVTFSATRGVFTGGVTTATVNTDGTGTASVTITSTTAGPAVITASGTGVSAQVTINFIATNPAKIAVQASPATIQTSAQSTITAIVWDAQGNLVQGQTVDFQLTDKTGGFISVASAVTDAQGVAQTVYTATTTSSASGGVIITATVQGTALQSSVALTVGGQTVFLSLGTGNLISAPNSTQFEMPYVVQALDSAGNAVAGVTVTFTILSFPYADIPAGNTNADGSTSTSYAAYGKGYWVPTSSSQGAQCNGIGGQGYCQIITATCFNEDIYGSGVLQTSSEDINGNGKLDPGNVASVTPGTVVTDSTGTANVNIFYPQDHAAWVHVKLTASASVAGTQSSTSATFWLPMLASDIANSTGGTPPGNISPYGLANVCTNPN